MRISDWSSDVCSSDLAADTDRFSPREIGHLVAHRADMADDLMAGNARVMRAAPFAADLMKVRMADAAIGDLDDDVVRAGLAAGDRQRLERTIGGVGAIGFGGHATLLDEAALRRALGPAEDRCRRRGILDPVPCWPERLMAAHQSDPESRRELAHPA